MSCILEFKKKVWYYLTPISMATVKKTVNSSVDKDAEKVEPMCIAGGNIKMVQLL